MKKLRKDYMNKLTVVHLNGTKITSKESFLKEIAIALELPEGVGYTWETLEDCLRDLKGKYLIIWTYFNSPIEWVQLIHKAGIKVAIYKYKATIEPNEIDYTLIDLFESLSIPYTYTNETQLE